MLAGAVALTLLAALTPPNDHPLHLFPWEKGDHVVAFAVLAAAAACAFPRARLILVCAVVISFGVAIELLQALPIVSRDPEMTDVGWDALGAGIGLAAAAGARRWLPKAR